MRQPETVVLLCRGCCCSTPDKHPDVDHDRHDRLLGAAADAHPDVRVRVVDRLYECDRSNVAVLRREAHGEGSRRVAPARRREARRPRRRNPPPLSG